MSDNILPAFYTNYMRNGKVKSWSEIMVRSNFYFHSLTHFQTIFHFSTPWKHRKTSNFSDVFGGGGGMGYRSGILVENGLNFQGISNFINSSSYEKQIKIYSLWISKKQLLLHYVVSLYYHKSSGTSGQNRGQIKKACGRCCKTR